MLKAIVVAVIVGLFSSGATEYQPPPIPYSGCISAVYPNPDGSIHETGISCSIVIPMLASD